MVQINYISAANAKLLTDDAQAIIQRLQETQQLFVNIPRQNGAGMNELEQQVTTRYLRMYPNPFRDATLVTFGLASKGWVETGGV
jgi:hypothetical protein